MTTGVKISFPVIESQTIPFHSISSPGIPILRIPILSKAEIKAKDSSLLITESKDSITNLN